MEMTGPKPEPHADQYSAIHGASFYGTTRHKVSGRNQVAVPKSMLKSLEHANEGSLLLIRWQNENCLWLYTQKQMDKKIKDIRANDSLPQDSKNILIHHLASNAVTIDPDTQGRFVLPAQWVEALNLREEVVFCGAQTRIEIWSVSAHAEKEAKEREQVAAAAQEVSHILAL